MAASQRRLARPAFEQVVLVGVGLIGGSLALGVIGPHLPQGALVTDVGSTKERICRAAGGFRDVTRTASSPYELWRDILATNLDPIRDQLAAFRVSLDRLEKALGSHEAIRSELTEAARHRLNVPHDLPGLHHPEDELTVQVLDEPGALAAVTTALAREQINIRDIQVLKVRQDEDGVLRLAFVDRTESRRAADVLRRAGHDVRVRSEPR